MKGNCCHLAVLARKANLICEALVANIPFSRVPEGDYLETFEIEDKLITIGITVARV